MSHAQSETRHTDRASSLRDTERHESATPRGLSVVCVRASECTIVVKRKDVKLFEHTDGHENQIVLYVFYGGGGVGALTQPHYFHDGTYKVL